MKVGFTKRADKQLRKMPDADRAAIVLKLETYAVSGIGDVTKLVGSDELRLRHGQWRAIFVVRNHILVLKEAHRREAYK
ncbi:MAG: type II toxin-antitoxin system RelE/ParE family toxin [Pseudomonadota bacterium]